MSFLTMLPRLSVNSREPMKEQKYESIAPPDISIEQQKKGGFALRKLKQYCDEMHLINKRVLF